MRNVLLLAVIGFSTIAIACGDASGTDVSSRRGTETPSGSDDPSTADTTPGQDTGDTQSNPTQPTQPPQSTGSFTLAVDKSTLSSDLDAKDAIANVTVTAVDGFTGNVALEADGLPTGVTAVFTPTSIGPGQSAKVEFDVAASAAPNTTGAAITIKGTSAAQSATTPVSLGVNNVITARIQVNSDALAKAGTTGALFGPSFDGSATAPKFVSGVHVKVFNGDSTAIEIHGENGFQHGQGQIKPNAYDMLTNNGTTLDYRPIAAGGDGYIHSSTDLANGSKAQSFKVLTQ